MVGDGRDNDNSGDDGEEGANEMMTVTLLVVTL